MEKTLLDTVIERFEDDRRTVRDVFPAPAQECDGQLSLFDVSEDGDTMVSHDGQTL